MGGMTEKLKKTYLALLIPAIVAIVLAFGLRQTGLILLEPNIPTAFIAPFVFVLSVVFAIALPILIRSLFAHTLRRRKSVSEAVLFRFERKLIFVSLLTPYLILPAYLLNFSDFHLIGTALMALYAVYYFYPSKKRIQFERRVFRAK